LRDIGDAVFELDRDQAAAPPAGASAVHRSWRIWAGAGVIGLAAGLGIGRLNGLRSVAPTAPVTRFMLDVRPAATLLGAHPGERTLFGRSRPSRAAVAVSPDGRAIVFSAATGSSERLYVRA